LYQHAELAHWLRNRDTMKILPAQVDIDLTNICNQDCFYCNSKEHREAAHDLGVRMLYFRPVILNGQAFEIYDGTVELMDLLSDRMGVKYKLNTNKTLPRNYSKCHQMFQFPVCCADGNVYVCCDNKGNPEFSIGNWLEEDIRDIWLSDRHWEVYNKINTNFCQPCRPNSSNIKIQDVLNDPDLIETLYL
jgi:sulfatase maturation enzyme AslB (radical SAM superfamily)